jgi:hypothetical protein
LQIESDAKINIFDATGKLIYTYFDHFLTPGKHFFYFTAEQIPSGTYYYGIESPLGSVIVNKTMIVVK